MPNDFGTRRKSLPPAPPPTRHNTHASAINDPRFDCPAEERDGARQQLIVYKLKATRPPVEGWEPPPSMPTEGPLAGKMLCVVAQALDEAPNGKRLAASCFFWPVRGEGDGSRKMTKIDHWLERILPYPTQPGTLRLGDLLGLNFLTSVSRTYRFYRGQRQPAARFKVMDPGGSCRLLDAWPPYEPYYQLAERDWICIPRELADYGI